MFLYIIAFLHRLNCVWITTRKSGVLYLYYMNWLIILGGGLFQVYQLILLLDKTYNPWANWFTTPLEGSIICSQDWNTFFSDLLI